MSIKLQRDISYVILGGFFLLYKSFTRLNLIIEENNETSYICRPLFSNPSLFSCGKFFIQRATRISRPCFKLKYKTFNDFSTMNSV